MRIPFHPPDREEFFADLIEKCLVTQEERKTDYGTQRSWFLFGAGPEQSPALFNKIGPHIETVASFTYSQETTRFAINLGATAPKGEEQKVPALTQAIHDKWLDSNADHVVGQAVIWSMVYNSSYVKLVTRKEHIIPYMVDPGCVGILREDMPYTDRQEAFVHCYYITRSDLYDRLYSHPKRESILQRITTSAKKDEYIPDGVNRIIMSQTNPQIFGNVNLDLEGMPRYKARVGEEVTEMRELWVWDDDKDDYTVVTMADPDVLIYDRAGEKLFLKGELPFIHFCPTPLPDYYWGASEVQRLILLQDMRNKRVDEIQELLSRNVNPPTTLAGFTGLIDEKNFALHRAGGVLPLGENPQAKAEQYKPEIPEDAYKELDRIDQMFEEASGVSAILAGRGESGVRSASQASQLARLGSARIKKRAMITEDSLEKTATLYLKLMQAYDTSDYKDEQGQEFIASQFTKDFSVKVDAHSNSPVFMEDMRTLAFNLRKVGAIDNEDLLELVDIPGKQLLKAKNKKRAAQAAANPQQHQPETKGTPGRKPEIRAVHNG